jgi:exodeoxyribonuclease V alpha subunit
MMPAKQAEPTGRAVQSPVRSFLLPKWLATDPEFVGIGFATAAKLAAAFGDSLHAVLASDSLQVLTPILGEHLSRQLLATYREKIAEAEVIAWLDKHQFDNRLAKKIVRIWGDQAIRHLQSNPYWMLAFAPWQQVDAAARGLGITSLDVRRLIASVEAVLYDRLADKSTHTDRRCVLRSVCKRLRVSEEIAASALNQAILNRAVFADGTGLQPVGAAIMESYVAARIQHLTAVTSPTLFRTACGKERLETMLNDFETGEHHRLTPEQRAAVRMAVDHPVSVLTGGAGVGKTTVLKAIRRVLEAVGCQVETVALSGRAAKRIAEAIGRPAKTIAAFLQSIRSGKLRFTTDALVIVDEASMLDLPTLYRIMRAAPEHLQYLFVGDAYQLPPIGFGLTFHLWAGTGALPTVRLTQIHRQSEDSGIPRVAEQIRAGTAPSLPSYSRYSKGVSFLGVEDGNVMDALLHVVSDYGLNECQVISPLKRGPSGVETINTYFHGLLKPGRRAIKGGTICEGEPIIWAKNDWQRGLTNGSMGRLLSVEADSGIAQIEVDGHTEDLLPRDWDNIDLAYAITVHKAQGSQFNRVLMPITASRLLDRALLYTAITRAVDCVILVGDLAAFRRAAIAAPQSHTREVGAAMYLTEQRRRS